MSDDLDSFFAEIQELASAAPAPAAAPPQSVSALALEAAEEDKQQERSLAGPVARAPTMLAPRAALRPSVLSKPAVISKPPQPSTSLLSAAIAAATAAPSSSAPRAPYGASYSSSLQPPPSHFAQQQQQQQQQPQQQSQWYGPPSTAQGSMGGGMAAAASSSSSSSSSAAAASGSGGSAAAAAASSRGLKRGAAGEVWTDPTMADWPENDYRLFVANLGPEVTEDMLRAAFARFPTFAKCRVIKPRVGQGSQSKVKPFGFVSFTDPWDALSAMKEMEGAYIGTRPCSLRKSNWKERGVAEQGSKRARL